MGLADCQVVIDKYPQSGIPSSRRVPIFVPTLCIEGFYGPRGNFVMSLKRQPDSKWSQAVNTGRMRFVISRSQPVATGSNREQRSIAPTG
jgi:hypothetical protein